MRDTWSNLVTGTSDFYAIVGDPIHLAKTPEIFNGCFWSKHMDSVFLPFHVGPEGLKGLFEFFRHSDNFKGMVVTMPYKSAAVAYVDSLSSTASVLGSINIVFKDNNKLVGSMVDGDGMLRAINSKNPTLFKQLPALKIGLLGSGNAASAIAHALIKNGVKNLCVFSAKAKTDEAKPMLDRLGSSVREYINVTEPQACDVLINATPLGMYEADPLPFDQALIAQAQLVADVVTAPTAALIQQAKTIGVDAVTGADMARAQSGLIADLFNLPKLFD